jgi:hypothetical protein
LAKVNVIIGDLLPFWRQEIVLTLNDRASRSPKLITLQIKFLPGAAISRLLDVARSAN